MKAIVAYVIADTSDGRWYVIRGLNSQEPTRLPHNPRHVFHSHDEAEDCVAAQKRADQAAATRLGIEVLFA